MTMATIDVKLDMVLAQRDHIRCAQKQILDVKTTTDIVYQQLDSRILSRHNIGNRLRSVSKQLDVVQNKLACIQQVVETGVNSYYNTEMHLVQKSKVFRDL